jgi:4-hydroxybenzoate polyprenyltransferase
MCNVSNQARGSAEDAVNKPWRPLPSGRVTESQAVVLRWVTVSLCILYSAVYGGDVVLATLGLLVTTLLYDEGGFAGHYIGKNFCNIGGYTTLEIGATKLMGTFLYFHSCISLELRLRSLNQVTLALLI